MSRWSQGALLGGGHDSLRAQALILHENFMPGGVGGQGEGPILLPALVVGAFLLTLD